MLKLCSLLEISPDFLEITEISASSLYFGEPHMHVTPRPTVSVSQNKSLTNSALRNLGQHTFQNTFILPYYSKKTVATLEMKIRELLSQAQTTFSGFSIFNTGNVPL